MKPRVLFLLFLILQLVAGHFDREACGKDKHCIFAPTGCEERNDCSQMFSYNLADDGWVDMEMFFTNGKPTDAYIAVGFSDDQEMGREPVTQCVFPSGGKPTVAFSYNVGKSNAPPTKEDDLGESEFAPPLNQTFHILLATGPAQNERAIGIHGLDPKTSSFPYIHKDQVNVMTTVKRAAAEPEEAPTTTTEAPSMTRQTKFWLVRVHGILMIFSWLVLIISAVLAARYLRDHFPSSAPCGLKWWFHIHRTLNVLSVPIILISTLLIFIAKEWTWKGPSAGKTSAENTSAGSIHSLVSIA
ncbi:unnamed protein product [Nippostrongylus brasiliensis]|uniref:Ferric-chelate reductase 1 (inferred by orthology to a human protein) n=1 Tax=Nippostrongylus brasiliensis TaxID=27835 RepID=A0A0N4XC62_NIPBR|nr:unnamed protein product [Nippostrongylus brasiliensis]